MSVVIGGPGPGQVIRPGSLTVTGTATGREGPEPVAIQSVTVNGRNATLTRTPGSATVGFTATVAMPAWVPTFTITVTAVDDNGHKTGTSVSVRGGGGWVGSWSELYTDNDYLGMLAPAANADGRIEVIGFNDQGTIWRTWQTQASDDQSWVGSWSELYTDNDTTGELAVARDADGRLEVFMVGGTGLNLNIWRTRQTRAGDDDSWVGSWSKLYINGTPLPTLRSIQVAVNADGRLEVFGMNGDALLHTAQTQPGLWDGGGWSTFDFPGTLQSSDYVVASNADGRLEVFVLSAVDAPVSYWRIAQSQPGSWDGAIPSELPLIAGQPEVGQAFAVGRNGDGRLELVAMAGLAGTSGRIAQTQPGSWVGASWVPFYARSEFDNIWPMRMMPNADGRLEIFVIHYLRQAHGSIWRTWRDWDVPYEGTPTGTVPDVINLGPDQASAQIQAAGFTFSSTATPVRGTLAPVVESQDPVGGATAPLGSDVSVTVAEPVLAIVPDVLNLPPGAARTKIEGAGFLYAESADPVEGSFRPYVEDQTQEAERQRRRDQRSASPSLSRLGGGLS
jgi:hypothetical protein